MTCKDARLLLSIQLDGGLTQEEARLLDEHLNTCETCRRYQALLSAAFPQATPVEVPAELTKNIMAAVAAMPTPKKKKPALRRIVIPILAAAACLVLCVGALPLLVMTMTGMGAADSAAPMEARDVADAGAYESEEDDSMAYTMETAVDEAAALDTTAASDTEYPTPPADCAGAYYVEGTLPEALRDVEYKPYGDTNWYVMYIDAALADALTDYPFTAGAESSTRYAVLWLP